MKSAKIILLLVVLVLSGLWLTGFFAPDPKIIINQRLKKLGELASFSSAEPSFQRFGKIKQLSKLFSEDVVIVADYSELENHTLHGRDELMQSLMAAKLFGTGLTLEFIDVNIEVGSEKQSALVELTVKGRYNGDSDLIAQEAKLTFKKIKGEWLITRGESVRTLKP